MKDKLVENTELSDEKWLGGRWEGVRYGIGMDRRPSDL
jgi:hypothetical protein